MSYISMLKKGDQKTALSMKQMKRKRRNESVVLSPPKTSRENVKVTRLVKKDRAPSASMKDRVQLYGMAEKATG